METVDIADIADLDGRRFGAVARLRASLDLALDPALPPMGAEELRAWAQSDRTESSRHLRLAVLDGEQAMAIGHLQLHDDPTNLGLCSAEIEWAAGERGAGDAARALLVELVEVAVADGRESMLGWGPRTTEQSALWSGAGLSERYREWISQLDLTAVDEALMTRWLSARQERAGDLELTSWVGRCPDEHLEAFVAAKNAMNDAPLEDVDMADVVNTAASVRLEEQVWADLGVEPWVMLATDPGGGAAGMTAVHVNGRRPAASWQWDTVVVADQRRRGVARWLKASMWRRLRAESPDVATLRTGNAQSNASMLSINIDMGYRPVHEMAAWQADLDVIAASLLRL
jgi:hypothetical protein